MKLEISDPATLLNNIAERYVSIERVLMEYIDNSLDDADDEAKTNKGTYPHLIKIHIAVDTPRKSIIFTDNCRGMTKDTLERVVSKIGESKKRGLSWVNGRFGFGIHAFRAFANKIEFYTKNKDDKQYYLGFTRYQMDDILSPKIINTSFESETGTKVILSEFNQEDFRDLSPQSIKNEIETHFERLLSKPNLEISISFDGSEDITCEPFNYASFTGKEFYREININTNKTHKIEIFLKVTEVITKRTVNFFAKGRRIAPVSDIKSFIHKSKYKLGIWESPHLSGYIECGELVDPVITRDDFVRGVGRNKFYESILDLEEEVKEILDTINKKYDSENFKTLEDILSKELRKLAREDFLKFRSELVASRNGTVQLIDGGGSDISGDGQHKKKKGKKKRKGKHGGTDEGDEYGPGGKGIGPNAGTGIDGPKSELGESKYLGELVKKSGFDIKIVSIAPTADGKPIRSQFIDGVIVINKEHTDFESRLESYRTGQQKVGDRLIAYIAAVVSIHYKDQYYKKYKTMPDEARDIFEEQLQFISRLEEGLHPLKKEIEASFKSE